MKQLITFALAAFTIECGAQTRVKQVYTPCTISRVALFETKGTSDVSRTARLPYIFDVTGLYERVFLIGANIDPMISARDPKIYYLYEDPCLGHLAVTCIIAGTTWRDREDAANKDISYRSQVSAMLTCNINYTTMLSSKANQAHKCAEMRSACSRSR